MKALQIFFIIVFFLDTLANFLEEHFTYSHFDILIVRRTAIAPFNVVLTDAPSFDIYALQEKLTYSDHTFSLAQDEQFFFGPFPLQSIEKSASWSLSCASTNSSSHLSQTYTFSTPPLPPARHVGTNVSGIDKTTAARLVFYNRFKLLLHCVSLAFARNMPHLQESDSSRATTFDGRKRPRHLVSY